MFCEDDEFKGFQNETQDFKTMLFNRVYFVCETLSTVGYGDIRPKSMKAKWIVLLMFLFLITELKAKIEAL